MTLPGRVSILGFSRFLDFLKNIFGKMQSRADGEGKCFIIGGGYDICLFDVAAGDLCVWSKNEFFFFRK